MIPAFHGKYLIRVAAAWLCALAWTWAVPGLAQQATVPLPPTPPSARLVLLIPPPAALQFQQSVQQQQVLSQLQQRQLESNLHRSVTEQAARPLDRSSGNRTQLDQAEQAQMARDQAAQQSLVNQYWGIGATQPPSRVLPARARSGH